MVVDVNEFQWPEASDGANSFADLLQTVKPNISHDQRIATLPIIRYEVIEGGEKGQTVALATNLATNKFFSLGVANIQNECNSVARRYYALWKTKPSEQKMSEYQLPDLTYAQGISEVLPDFVLFELPVFVLRYSIVSVPRIQGSRQQSSILRII
jgi:hypothetical protein